MPIPRIETPPIRVPRNIIDRLPPPVVSDVPVPVTRGLQLPVIDVPNPIIDYPTLDVPTEQEFQSQMDQGGKEETESEQDTRDLPTTQPIVEVPPTPDIPTINIGGIEAPLPDPAPLITAGATAVVTTTVTLGATILVGKVKDSVLEPMMKRVGKKKVKIKSVKPVLHFVQAEEGHVDIFEYTAKGTRMVDQVDDVERYLRDQVEIDSLYEYDNKVIIDDVIKEKFTKEGAKRFKSLFAPAKSIAKKLGARFSI